MLELALWYVFPSAIVIATIALMSGIGGAILFSPFLIIVVGLDPVHAIAASLLIEVFGFSSGLFGYFTRKEIDFGVARKLIVYSVPFTVIGALLAHFIPNIFLIIALIVLLVVLSLSFLLVKKVPLLEQPASKNPLYFFPCTAFMALGGFLMGLISAGLGELDEYLFLERLTLSPAIAAGTSVLLVAASALIGVIAHGAVLLSSNINGILLDLVSVLLFALPGVVIGAQIGVRLAEKVSEAFMSTFLGSLFMFIGIILTWSLF